MTNTHDDGGPAFPVPAVPTRHGSESGMSLRDWFAGMALQGLLVGYDSHEFTVAECAELAIQAADAMLAARKEGGR